MLSLIQEFSIGDTEQINSFSFSFILSLCKIITFWSIDILKSLLILDSMESEPIERTKHQQLIDENRVFK